MAELVTLKNVNSAVIKEAPIGFSWTTLFFGFIVAIVRGDIKWAAIQLGVSIITLGISNLVMPFIYNKIYVKELLETGYVPSDERMTYMLIAKGIMFAPND
tara:strand:+ start:497 stop:799 length:303 start_codon:yes stop_codon:yes gene_type:complete